MCEIIVSLILSFVIIVQLFVLKKFFKYLYKFLNRKK